MKCYSIPLSSIDASFHPSPYRQVIETAKTRLIISMIVLIFGFLVIAFRLCDVMMRDYQREEVEDRSQTAPRGLNIPVQRTNILDRNGQILATSVTTCALYANPKVMIDIGEAAQKLAPIISTSVTELQKKLEMNRGFIWLARHLTPKQKQQIIHLGIPGLGFQPAERRVYPHGSLLAHLIGYTDIDGHGISGIEQSFETILSTNHDPLVLSIDLRVQHILYEELSTALITYRAEAGNGILLDIQTGEIIAMISLPSFDPNKTPKTIAPEQFNRNITGLYEIGSAFKIANTAMALESGLIHLNSRYDLTNPIQVDHRFKIKDFTPNPGLHTVSEIFLRSSNIGSVKIALELGVKRQKKFLDTLGFLKPLNLEIAGCGAPLTPSPWRDVNLMTISYGYGVAITPLHVVTGIAGILNGGLLNSPTLLKRQNPLPEDKQRRIVSPKTSAAIRYLMRLTAQDGTARRAAVPGYEVGAKTSTANRLENGRYNNNARLASVISAFPMSAPRYALFIMLDNPKPPYGQRFAPAGLNAAPTTAKVIARAAPLLGVLPVYEPLDSDSSLILKAVNYVPTQPTQ